MKLFFLVIAFFLTVGVNAQRVLKVDSDIVLHETIDSLRKDLNSKVQKNDKNLVSTLNTQILYLGQDTLHVFFPAERAISLFITGNFSILLNDISAGIDYHYNTRSDNYKRHEFHLLTPGEYHEVDDLLAILNRNVENINLMMNRSVLSDDELSFLDLYLKSILAYNDLRKFDTGKMKSDCHDFINNYPNSPYNEYVDKVLFIRLKTQNFGVGAGVFTGYNNLGGEISDYFRNFISVGVTLEGGYKRMLVKAEFAPSFSQDLRQTFNYKGNTWSADSTPFIINGNVNLGYVLYDTPKYRFTPYIGAGYNGARLADGINMQFQTGLNCGVEVDWKFAEDKRYGSYQEAFHSASNNTNWHLRLRLGYSKFQNRDSRFSGYLLYTKIVIGFFSNPSRKVKS
jgi:hypothetical protein